MTFFVVFIVLPLALPFPVANLGLIGRVIGGIRGICGGIICSGGILLAITGPRNTPEPRGLIGGMMASAMPRALGPGKSGSKPLGRDTPVSRSGSGSLCLIEIPNTGLIIGGAIGIPGGTSLPPNLGGGSGRTPAGGALCPKRGPLLSGLILTLRFPGEYFLSTVEFAKYGNCLCE